MTSAPSSGYVSSFNTYLQDSFPSLANRFQEYKQHLPKDMVKVALQSAVFSGAMACIFSTNFLGGAALGATVSLIHSLAIPLFRSLLANSQDNFKWYHQVIVTLISFKATEFLVSALTGSCPHLLLSPLLLQHAWNGFNDQPYDQPTLSIAIWP